ncbi:MAG: ABC transporter substrate-binding protein [Lachnospiraceae bacterium]|nr:ABC transporter substrate-binding protein [Lachnospiraceae bacterium]
MKRKLLAVVLMAAMMTSLVACGGSGEAAAPAAEASEATEATEAAPAEEAAAEEAAPAETAGEYALDKITMVVDGTLTATVDSGQKEFNDQWDAYVSEKLGHDIHLDIQQQDHSGYVDAVGRIFASGSYPDVMIMPASMYTQYLNTGILWDMTEAYDNADFQSRMLYPEVNENVKAIGGGKLYGIAPTYGNGCVTYVKKAWLDNVEIDPSTIKTFDDYYAMLKAFHEKDPDGNGTDGDTYGVIAAGYLKSDEAPYINYLPEFWQDAYPAIYQKDGTWIDGFQEQATKDALERLHQAYVDGVIDPLTLTAGTKDAREKWFSNDQTGSAGVFTYWAGTWYQNLTDSLSKNDVDSEIVEIEPIAEVGAYINREAPVWVIIDDGDGDNAREQAIFDAFFETMLDGGRGQILWTYGAEDVHWSTKAESFTTNADDPEKKKDYEYADGEFHLKQSPNDPNTVWKKNHLDPALTIVSMSDEFSDFVSTTSLAAEGNAFFTAHMKDAPASPSSATLTEAAGTIKDAKDVMVSSVIVDGVDVDTAMETYVATVGPIIEQILAELNSAE